LDIGGLPVIVADTAGLRHTEDVVESIGIDRAKKASVSLASSLSTQQELNLFFDGIGYGKQMYHSAFYRYLR